MTLASVYVLLHRAETCANFQTPFDAALEKAIEKLKSLYDSTIKGDNLAQSTEDQNFETIPPQDRLHRAETHRALTAESLDVICNSPQEGLHRPDTNLVVPDKQLNILLKYSFSQQVKETIREINRLFAERNAHLKNSGLKSDDPCIVDAGNRYWLFKSLGKS